MKDETIIRMIQETCEGLREMNKKPFPVDCRYLQPSYNALVQAARSNHSGDAFLSGLSTIEQNGEVNPMEMQILFAQLRIALESLQELDGSRDAAAATAPTISYVGPSPGT